MKVLINNRDRLTPLKKLIEWLWCANQHEIVVLDNASSYPPLLAYYRVIERQGVQVKRLRANIGAYALWKQSNKGLLRPPFVLTDSDCVPTEECPLDLIDFLWRAGNEIKGRYQSEWGHPTALQKIGPAFKLSNIPDTYKLKTTVLEWETHIGGQGVGREQFEGVEIYDAAIDTTFALYFDGSQWGYGAARVGAPFLIDHLDWHVNSGNLSEEEAYYQRNAKTGAGYHSWGPNKCYNKTVNQFCQKNRARRT